jgi:hypothetical protein
MRRCEPLKLFARPGTINGDDWGDDWNGARRRGRLSAKIVSASLIYGHLRASRAPIEKPDLTFPAAVIAGRKKPLERSTPDPGFRIRRQRFKRRAPANRASGKGRFPAAEKAQSAVMALRDRNIRKQVGPLRARSGLKIGAEALWTESCRFAEQERSDDFLKDIPERKNLDE